MKKTGNVPTTGRQDSSIGSFFDWLWKAAALMFLLKVASAVMTSDAFQQAINS